MKWIPHNAFIIIVLITFTLCSNTDIENNKPTINLKKENVNIKENIKNEITPIKQNEMPRFISLEAKEKKTSNEKDSSELYMDWDSFFGKEENKQFSSENNEKNQAQSQESEIEPLNNFIEKKVKGQKVVKGKKKPAKGKKGKGKKGGFNFKVVIADPKSFLNVFRQKLIVKVVKGKKQIKDKNTIATEKKVVRYQKCNIKTGILLEFLGIKTNTKTMTHEATMKSTYVELTKGSINLKNHVTNENALASASIYKVLRLKDILRISQQKKLQAYSCFDLVHYINAKSDKEGKITLCAQNQAAMENWVNAIQEFKECQIKVSKINNNNQLVYDFSKVNHLLKIKKEAVKKAPTVKKVIKRPRSLYYDNVQIKKKDALVKTSKKDLLIKKAAKNILKNFRVMRIRTRQIERKMADKAKVAKAFEKKMLKKQANIQRDVAEKVRQQKLQKIVEKIEGKKKQQLNLLKAVSSKLMNMEKAQIKNVTRRYRRKAQISMKKAEKKSAQIMNTIIEAKKLTPYEECFDPRLKNFNNKIYIGGICKRMFGNHVRI